MNRKLWVGILFAITAFFVTNTYADSTATQQQQLSLLSGKILVVDMGNVGTVSKAYVMNGTDLLIGTINNDKAHKAPAFNIETINDFAVLAQFDGNHDGTIEQDELAKSNLVLIRFNPDRSITIIPLALSNIKEIHYKNGVSPTNNSNQSLNVWLTAIDGKKYQTYYLNF